MTPEELYLKNEKLVHLVLNQHFPTFRNSEDLQQEGRIGLWKACLTYDESKGYTFATYATKCIYTEICLALRKTKHIIQALSLQQIISGEGDSAITLEDVLVGDLDVEYSDFELFCKRLTPMEKKIVEYRLRGLNMRKIGEKLGVSRTTIWKQFKKIREKFD